MRDEEEPHLSILRSSFRLLHSILMESEGLEPSMTGVQSQCLPNLATIPKKNQNIAFLSAISVLHQKFGRSGETRTHDPLLVRQPLLPLSYASKSGVRCQVSGKGRKVFLTPDT